MKNYSMSSQEEEKRHTFSAWRSAHTVWITIINYLFSSDDRSGRDGRDGHSGDHGVHIDAHDGHVLE